MTRIVLSLALLISGVLPSRGPAPAQVDPREDEDFSNSAFVRTSDEVKAELFFAAQKVEQQEWAAAVQAYQGVLDRDEPAVVEFSDRVYLSAHEAARRHLARLPEEARARYRELFDARAEAARRLALRLFDPDRLVRVARRYPLSSVAPEALDGASALAAERGDSATLTRVVRLRRRLGAPRPVDVARLALALADDGDRAAVEALRRRERGRLEAPVDGAGTLAEVFERALGRSPPAVDPARLEALASGPIAYRFVAQLPPIERLLVPRREPDALGYAPIRYPAVGLAEAGGAPWIFGRSGAYRIGGGLQRAGPTVSYAEDLGVEPRRQVSSRTLAPAADGARLYLVLNERERSYYQDEERSRLVCLDARDGSVRWQVDESREGGDSRLEGVVLEGPPVVVGDAVLVPGSRLTTGTECSLFAFDRESGALRWSRFLASAEKVPRFVARNRKTSVERAEPSPVVVAEGVAFVTTNVGVVAAVDARSGEALWLFRYNRVKPSDPETFRRVSIYDTGGWLPSPPEVAGEWLVAAPEDSHFLYVLARSPSDGGHLVGPDPLFKAGREKLVGFDRERGQLLFLEQLTHGHDRARVVVEATRLDGATLADSVPLQLEEEVTGRPAIVGDALFLSTNKALYRYRLDKGLMAFDSLPVPDALLRARERFAFGNLSLVGGRLYSVSPLALFEIVPR